MKKITLISFVLLAFLSGLAQDETTDGTFKLSNGEKKWKGAINLGVPVLGGDADVPKLSYNLGVDVRRTISNSVGVRLYGGLGTINGERGGTSNGSNVTSAGDNGSGDIPTDYKYKNNFMEASADVVLIISALDFDGDNKKDIQAYYGLGIGLWRNNVQGTFDNLSAYGLTEQPKLKATNAMVPIFLGLMKNINENIDIELEYKYRYLRSDMADGFTFDTWRNRSNDFVHTLNVRAAFKLGMNKGYDHSD